MIHHHPDDGLLLAQAAGTLSSGHSLLVASHVEGCAECQARLRELESIGGAMLEQLAPAVLPSQSLAEAMAAIDAPPPAPKAKAAPRRSSRPALPAGMSWPRALHGCSATAWRWLGPGMRWSRVTVPYDPAANVFLLRIGAGKELPFHTHSRSELTQVLHGAFHDGRALFGPGDFDEADGDIHHQPKVLAAGECICLASVEGRVMFQGAIARMLGSLVGM
ncbi:ChrR family anti-sigma-E factor [Variovorax sp. J31P179]|jgi:putative transcriptional regulator|uniref:ChrR family anti-sigma-E factor n=1 Tax=Variovorax sp. J31P179 TaxID=3053508 RepID=UPI002575AC36|nr:ChrR family anti-sigma-E factor [Variovorax sp. J31P179]MDM0085241.1 ChrR family anti-sigma-E factor [Variovorax sp. J31P179]